MAFGSYFGKPAHWMKQFHADFNPNADELARQNGFGAWYQYYTMMREYMHPHVNKLHVGPWIRVVSTTTHDIYQRNPYFAEVDQQGNQLPYIDRIYVQVVEDQKLQDARMETGADSEGRCQWPMVLLDRVVRLSCPGIISMHGHQAPATVTAAQVRTLFFIHGHRPFHKRLAPVANDSQVVDFPGADSRCALFYRFSEEQSRAQLEVTSANCG